MSREVLALADIDIDALMADPQAVQIIGREGRGKLLYHVPEGFTCCTVKLTYGEKGKDERAIFELRFQASNGHTIQDVLPPSVHPDTGKPYKLVGDITNIPPLPQALANLWKHWEEWKPVLQSLDPHFTEAINKAEPPRSKEQTTQVEGTIDPIAAFNERHTIHEVLINSGYKQKGTRRYIRPGSTSGVPGIVLLDESHIYSHGGDVLADGRKHDAFDLYRLLACGGKWKEALEWNPDITRHNQRLWREQKGKKQKRSPGTIPQAENPAAFEVDDKGVWYCWPVEPGEAPKRQWICSPLHVRAFTRDEYNEGWGRLLEFTDAETRQHVWAMPMRLLSGDGREYRAILLDMGLHIAPGRPARDCLMIYIQTANPEAWARCVERTGWYNGAFALPDEVIGGENGERVLLQTASNAIRVYHAAGVLKDWQREVSALCVGNSRLVFAVSCAFAAPLLSLVREENGGFHFRGPSSTGKTTVLFVACSVFGGRDYLQRWRATINGLEGVAVQHNDALLCLDELKQIDPREAGEVAYLLANGSGKQRANQHGGARDRSSWRLLFLSSGEISLTDHMRAAGKKAHAGQETRLADIPSDTGAHGVFENLHEHKSGETFARALTQAAHMYHGAAGREFLRHLTGLRPDEVAERVEELRKDFMKENVPQNASGQVQRVAMRFALVAAGGALATEAGITGWPEGEAIKAAVRCFEDWLAARGGAGNLEVEKALAQVRHFFELHGESRFTPWDSTCRSCDGEGVKLGDDGREFTCLTCKGKGKLNPQTIRTGNRAGFCRENTQSETEFYVFPEVFKEEVCAGMDPRFVACVLVKRGLIYPDKEDGKKAVSSHKPPGMKTIRLYHFAASILDSEG